MKYGLFAMLTVSVCLLLIVGCGSGGSSPKDIPVVSAVAFSPAAGIYNTDISIVMLSPTPGADIYYTTDGSVPSTQSELYVAPVVISGNGTVMTVRAMAAKSGMIDSLETTAVYTLDYDNQAVYIDPSVSISGEGTYSSPYKTWAEVAFSPGISYRQMRGTIAREEVLVNASGTADGPIILEAYGVGAMPIIQGSETEAGWSKVGDTEVYYKAIALTLGVNGFGMAAENGAPLKHLTWDIDVSTTFAEAEAGSYSYDFDSGIIYVWCTDGSSPDSHSMEISRRYFGIHGYGRQHVKVRDLHIRYVSLHGIRFEDSSRIDIRDCLVEKLGGAVILTSPFNIQAGNGIEFGNSCSDCTVRGCVIRDIFDSGISPQIYSDGHDASGFVFSDCSISRCGFSGVEIVILEAGTNSTLGEVVVRDIEITDTGAGWSGVRWGVEGRGIKVDANTSAGTIYGVYIEESRITGSVGEGVYIGGNAGVVTINRCAIYGNGLDGILVTGPGSDIGLALLSSLIYGNGFGADFKNGVTYNAPNGLGFTLIQNTLFGNNLGGFLIWEHAGECVIMNNLFHNLSYGPHLITGVPLPTGARMANNYFTEFDPGQDIFMYDVTGVQVGFDAVDVFDDEYAFASGNLGGHDPILVDPEGGDFSLGGPSSPCFRRGDPSAGINVDYRGTPFEDPPSIGAYEFILDGEG